MTRPRPAWPFLCRVLLFLSSALHASAVSIVALRGSERRTNQAGRILWTYWDDPAPPALVQLCLASLRKHAGPSWTVRVLSKESARQLVDAGDLPEHFDRLRPSFQADALRLALLRRQGGAWIDATTIATKDLSEWIDPNFDAGQFFVGYFIEHYSRPSGPPLVASWAMAVPEAEEPLMARWHEAYVHLWRNRTSEEDIVHDPFFEGADLSSVDPFMQDYLHVELVLLALLEKDAALREAFDNKATLMSAEATAYSLQTSMGLPWMANNKCAPVSSPYASLPQETQQTLQATPLVKLRHEDRQWLMKMSRCTLLQNPDSVLGLLLSRNAGAGNNTAGSGDDSVCEECADSDDS